MPARVSETFVLRTYPYKEADLIVSFFTRDQGKLRGLQPGWSPEAALGAPSNLAAECCRSPWI